jgi:endonuclease G
MLIPVDLLDSYEKKDVLKNVTLDEIVHTIENTSASKLDGREAFLKRRNSITKSTIGSVEEEFEAYYGDNDLLPIAYLELGTARSKSIGRIRFFDKKVMRNGVATGFLVSPELIVTNWHVFQSKELFRDAIIEFNCEYDCFGVEKEKIVFELDPDRFFYSFSGLDFALIAIRGKDKTDKYSAKDFGYLPLIAGEVTEGQGDFATIIQHPEGKLKQIAIRENRILDVSDPNLLTYYSDTARGSSGSAVFNNQWQLIALHSAGVAKKNEKGEYLDKDDNVIEKIGGSIPSERIVWLKNKGIRVKSIIEHLHRDPSLNTHALIVSLFASISNERERLILPASSTTKSKINESQPGIIPTSAVAPFSNLTISISLGTSIPEVQVFPGAQSKVDELAFEKKYEDNMDYSRCKGFDSFFMGEEVPLPKLSDSLKKKVAYLIDNPARNIIPYHHYSTIFHSVRRMPVVSAINIKGKSRYEELERGSVPWYRDYRIDYKLQLDDEWYVKTGFDKGHLSRYEDAEWGPNVGYAEKAAIMTCSYTNACPQAPNFNRAVFGYHGIWGRLEQAVLEEGVIEERGEEGKICVFNGPIFDREDPVFKGVMIPVRFFKIIVWRNQNKELKATAFLLSQAKQLEDYEFETLRYDEIFKRYQVSISHVERLTGLSFQRVSDWDTFKPAHVGEEERLITDEKEISVLIHEHRN